MNKTKRVIFFLLFVSIGNLHAQDDINLAFNLGSFGWGMDFSSEKKEGHLTYNFLNFYVEHKKSHIGIEFSPFNSWANYNHTNYRMNFFNARLYYNLLDLWKKNEDDGINSNYLLLGPFVSVNYLRLGNNQSFDPNKIQVSAGLKALAMIDISLFEEGSLPFGLQFLSLELGYRFNNYAMNNHQFYFNISTDILALVGLIGIFSGAGDEKEREKLDRRNKNKNKKIL